MKRRVGLGISGLADALIMCGVRYGSVEAQKLTHHWLKIFQEASYSWFAHFLGHKMNCIPHFLASSGVKLQENRVHSPLIFGRVKSREEPQFSQKKLLVLSENKGIFL